ncbi:MAG: hypothetical protein JW807_08330 [Spirochaetes bacterium]|nr:hypothetical protein [Spirochaetota bacterium]
MSLRLIHPDHVKGSAPFQAPNNTEAETRQNGLRLCYDAASAADGDTPEKRMKRGAIRGYLQRGIIMLVCGITILVPDISHAIDRLIETVKNSVCGKRRYPPGTTNTTNSTDHGNANLYVCKP